MLRIAEGNPAFIEHAKAQSALRRPGTLADIANTVTFLASDEGDRILRGSCLTRPEEFC